MPKKRPEGMTIAGLKIPDEDLEALCRKWKIRKLELFGSALTGQLRPDSDIDLLADFERDERWSLMDLVRAEEDFSSLFGRRAELVSRASLERSANWIRRRSILRSTQVVYGA